MLLATESRNFFGGPTGHCPERIYSSLGPRFLAKAWLSYFFFCALFFSTFAGAPGRAKGDPGGEWREKEKEKRNCDCYLTAPLIRGLPPPYKEAGEGGRLEIKYSYKEKRIPSVGKNLRVNDDFQ